MIPGQNLTDTSTEQKLPLGTRYFDESTGKVYYYVQANEALTKGDAVTSLVSIVNGDCDADSASDKTLVDATEDFTTISGFNGNLVGCYVKVADTAQTATNTPSCIADAPNRITKVVSATKLSLESAWSTSLTTDEDYVIFNPFIVEATDAAAEIVKGIIIADSVAAGEYAWMQSGGYCDYVKVVTAATNGQVTVNEGLVSSGTAGRLTGLTATTTADEAEKSNITALLTTALTNITNKNLTTPAFLRCLP